MAKVAPVGEPPSGSADEEEPKGAALQNAAVDHFPRPSMHMRHMARAKEYEALLSKVTKSSKRAKLMSVQGVLFGFTFMMSTFETSNR